MSYRSEEWRIGALGIALLVAWIYMLLRYIIGPVLP